MFKFFRNIFYAVVAFAVMWALFAFVGWIAAVAGGTASFTFASMWTAVKAVLIEKTVLSIALGGTWSSSLWAVAGATVAVTIGAHFSHKVVTQLSEGQAAIQKELAEISDRQIAESIAEEAEDEATAEAIHA